MSSTFREPDTESAPTERPAHLAPHGDSPRLGVLVGLFEALRKERKLDKRKQLLHYWFTVCFYLSSIFPSGIVIPACVLHLLS